MLCAISASEPKAGKEILRHCQRALMLLIYLLWIKLLILRNNKNTDWLEYLPNIHHIATSNYEISNYESLHC
jgi:hypothetical protein